MKLVLKVSFLLFLFCNPSSAQQTYFNQKNSLNQSKAEIKDSNPGSSSQANSFVGCIEYEVVYKGMPTNDKNRKETAEFLVQVTTKNYGVKRTQCFNEHGDRLIIYYGAELVDRVWYFSESNEEYTLFTNGVLKFSVNDRVMPEGSEDTEIAMPELRKTDREKIILGLETHQIVLLAGGKTYQEYWVSDSLLLNPRSYEKNKLGRYDELMEVVKGVPLFKKKISGGFFVTIEQAVEISHQRPKASLFSLPEVKPYHW